ncbi:MAG: hypothetical protein PHS51_05285 [Gallionella sp.]|nr:hypothetical protein [Gallionella sp.]
MNEMQTKFRVNMLRWFILTFLLCLATSALADSYLYDRNTIRLSDIPKDAPKFEDYPVKSIFKGKVAAPDVRAHPTSRLYRTAIRARAKAGVNFAGHYTLMGWGSQCTSWAIADVKTGRMFYPENFLNSDEVNVADEFYAHGGKSVNYRADSKLLVVIGGINEDPALRGISYFVWEDNKLKRIRFVPRPYLWQ